MQKKLSVSGLGKKFLRKRLALPLAHALSFSVGLGMILCIGPYLQLYLLSLLTSPENSIYSSAYGDSFIKFPGINTWFNGMLWPFTLVSAFFIFFVRKATNYRDVFVIAIVYFCFALTVLDLYAAFVQINGSNKINIFQCVISNIFGSLLIASYVLLVFRFTELILSFTRTHVSLQRVLALASPPVIGFAVSASAYYVCTLFFSLTPAKIDILLDPSTFGYYTSNISKKQGELSSATEKKFGLFSEGGNFNGDLEVINQTPLVFSWKKSDRPGIYKGSIMLYTGCLPYNLPTKVSQPDNTITFDNLNNLQVEIDSGITQLLINSKSGANGEVAIDNEALNIYWLSQDLKTKLLTLNRFPGSNSTLDYWSSSNKLKAYVSTYLIKSDKMQNSSLQPRRIKINADGVRYDLNFESKKTLNFEDKFYCNPITKTKFVPGIKVNISDMAIAVGIILQIERKTPVDSFSSNRKNALHINGINGWVSVKNLSNQDASIITSRGLVKDLSFTGGVKSFEMDGAKINASPFEKFTVKNGNLLGSLEPTGQLRFVGEAQAIFKDQSRLNKTRWERLDSSIKLLFLSVVATLFSSLFWLVVSSLQKNHKIRFS
ncbi:hypothetical protein [Glaciimonas soli]|uniref:Uncharacterized protein n=1 Tax=Glaciimonas soli TaxID=2590999 RepID=A0A843YM61_9BURK|nr:hypothetical protein [Glaciimonas soli]MQR00979.1 hypothetical protein [Glaciimonas soli]